jgi:hypothetical protein
LLEAKVSFFQRELVFQARQRQKSTKVQNTKGTHVPLLFFTFQAFRRGFLNQKYVILVESTHVLSVSFFPDCPITQPR